MKRQIVLSLLSVSFAFAACSKASLSDTQQLSQSSGFRDNLTAPAYPSSVDQVFSALRKVGIGKVYGWGGIDCSGLILAALKNEGFLDPKKVVVNGHEATASYIYGRRFDDDMRASQNYFTTCKGSILEGDLLHIKRYDQTCESEGSHWLVVKSARRNQGAVTSANWTSHVTDMIDMSPQENFYEGPVRSSFPDRWTMCSCVRVTSIDKHWEILRQREGQQENTTEDQEGLPSGVGTDSENTSIFTE